MLSFPFHLDLVTTLSPQSPNPLILHFLITNNCSIIIHPYSILSHISKQDSTNPNMETMPDLSLHISPPFSFSQNSESSSSGSDLSHELGILPASRDYAPNRPAGGLTLSLSLDPAPDASDPLCARHNDQQHSHQYSPQLYNFKRNNSKAMSRGSSKRNVRAPRMRWTTTLHAHFVHAVELLGGHESMFNFNYS